MAKSFETTLRQAVARIARRTKTTDQKAFASWYVTEVLGLDSEDALEATSYDSSNDKSVDVFFVDDESERVLIAQTTYLQDSNHAPKQDKLAGFLDCLDELADPQELRNEGRSDLAEAAEALSVARAAGYTLELHFVHSGVSRTNLDRKVRLWNRKIRSEDPNTSAVIFAMPELERFYEDTRSPNRRIEHASVAIRAGSTFEQEGTYGRSLVVTLPGTSLKKLYGEHDDRLFAENIRLYIPRRKGSVNEGITGTLEDPTDRPNFWAYNNGLTIVAEDYKLNRAKTKLELYGFSICNGCQTTVSLASADDGAAKDAEVLAKVVATADKNLVDRIIRYTNSQTPINPWDLSARDPVHRRLQSQLASLEKPWFYALRRGEFETLATGDQDRFGPRGARRTLTFPLCAQYLAVFRGLPVEAYKDKARLFTSHRDRVFPAATSTSELLWAWHVGRASETAISEFRAGVDVDAFTSTLLRRGARFFVSAIAAQLLRSQNGADFPARVDPSRLGDKAMEERLARYALTAVSYYVAVMRQEVPPPDSLTVFQRNSGNNAVLAKAVDARLFFERKTSPKQLAESLPKLPGIPNK